MKPLGYEIGEIKAEGAMTSEIAMRNDVTLEAVNKDIEIERRTLDRYEGMNRKYTPFMFDLVTGTGICGGRYVFDSWDHVQAYDKWLNGLELEPGVKFWDRPIFTQVDKHIWKVVGAHDFTPVATHGVNRFERWRYDAPADEVRAKLDALWPALRAEAGRQDLGTAWLLVQPDENLVAVVSTGHTAEQDNDVDALRQSVETLARMPSLGGTLTQDLGLTKVFDRTTPILSTWLPLSRRKGGAPVANPSAPPWSLPDVAPEEI